MKRDNKGFTLLEVLIAVIILALIAVPMLRSFTSSYRVNARSRELMRATTLAQNEMEIFEKEKLDVLLDGTKYADYHIDQSKTYETTDPTTGKKMTHTAYTFTYDKGIVNDESGREMFDVVVKMDPKVASEHDLYYIANTEPMLFMNTLSGADSGAYVQRVRNSVNADGEDEEVYRLYANTRQHPEGTYGSNLTMDQFASLLDRTITVKIEREEEDDPTVVTVNYMYNITGYDQVREGLEKYSGGDKVIFNNAQTLDKDGKMIELQSVYLFYAPRYKTPNVDKIVIENEDNLPVNVYVIRQNIQDPDNPGNVQDTPPGYQVSVDIHEGVDSASNKTNGSYFTNLDLTYFNTFVNLYDSDHGGIYSGNEAIDKTKFRSIGSQEAKDRIYTLHVAVYRHGADIENDEPLVELTGTKIE